MKTLIERYLPVRNAPGEGGGGGGGEGGGAPAGAGAAADGGGSNAEAAAAQPYRPQGLPETMFGKDDRETMDKIAGALAGYRQRDSERGVPDNVDAYAAFDAAQAPEFIRDRLPHLAKDPAFAAAAKVFMENGVPVKAMQSGMMAAYQALNDAGMLEPIVDGAAERALLLPESAKGLSKTDQDQAIEQRLQANEDFIKLMMKPGADGKSPLDTKVGEHALLMLMDTAAGNQFLEFVRGQITGEGRAQPFGGSGQAPSGSTARDGLRARLAAPEMQKGHPAFSQAAYDQLMADYQKTIPG